MSSNPKNRTKPSKYVEANPLDALEGACPICGANVIMSQDGADYMPCIQQRRRL